MTITLTFAEWDELHEEAWEQTAYSPEHEPFVGIGTMPEVIGSGIQQDIEVYPDVVLGIGQCTYRDEFLIKHPEAEHPIQFGFVFSGRSGDSNGGQFSPNATMISGSGIQRNITSQYFPQELMISIDISMPADRLTMFFPDPSGQIPAELSFLVKGNDWQTLLYPKSSSDIQRVVQEIVTCPYQGFEKRLYLQRKVHDLIGLQLMSVLRDRGGSPPSTHIKPQTVARIHYAKEVLLMNLENPPSSLELAEQVGVSDRTLRKGFQEIFGTTITNYLTQKRLERAEQLLRNHATVAEAANQLGYSHLGHFAAAFKRQFGILPSDCLLGKKSISPNS